MVSTTTLTCLVCSTEYPYRKSKQYCSNACKQQAYLSNKAGIPLKAHASKETPAYNFSLSEYELYQKAKDDGMHLLYYCFLRRNLKGPVEISQIIAFFDAMFNSGYNWWDYYERHVKGTKAYETFTDEFLSGKYTIGP